MAVRLIGIREHLEESCTAFGTDSLEFFFRHALVVANPDELFRFRGSQPVLLRLSVAGR